MNLPLFYGFIISAACSMAFLASPAQAANGEWATVAAGCVPDEGNKTKHSFEQARFEFAATNIGEIVARCNITDPADLFEGNPIWDLMDVTYSDPDGAGNSARVRVQLRRVHETTGASSTLATFDSNGFAAGQQLRSLNFAHTFDFTNYAYYLTLILNRSSSNVATPRIQRVRLYKGPIN